MWTLLIGGVAGWIVGHFMKGKSYGIILNIILGVLGGWVGGFLLGILGFESSGRTIPELITAVIGAVILVWVYQKYFDKPKAVRTLL